MGGLWLDVVIQCRKHNKAKAKSKKVLRYSVPAEVGNVAEVVQHNKGEEIGEMYRRSGEGRLVTDCHCLHHTHRTTCNTTNIAINTFPSLPLLIEYHLYMVCIKHFSSTGVRLTNRYQWRTPPFFSRRRVPFGEEVPKHDRGVGAG